LKEEFNSFFSSLSVLTVFYQLIQKIKATLVCELNKNDHGCGGVCLRLVIMISTRLERGILASQPQSARATLSSNT
jgi:hypothetical protein